jgi:hypothetical protein
MLLPAGGEAAEPARCDAAALAAAAAADQRLREIEECDPAEIARFAAAVRALDSCAGKIEPAKRWVFPVSRMLPSRSIGGHDGSGYRRSRHLPCYAVRYPGHPAHDLFVRDVHPTARDREGRAFEALAVEDGIVLVAHGGWQPGDAAKGGNYVLLYLPAHRWIAYYAHLGAITVKAGDHVVAGQVLGTIGRSGKNAWRCRSQTHLHFGTWSAATFQPFNSYKWLVGAWVSE